MTDVPASPGAAAPNWWKTTWPLHTEEYVRLALWLVVVIGAGAVLGLVLTRWTDPNALTELDQRLAADWAAARTDTQTDLATWGARVSDTVVKIGLTALLVGAMVLHWRRWHEGVFVAATLIFEATAFIAITHLVGRERPADRLLDSPVDSSFPSGHVAAATVYAAFAVVVFWHTRARWARALAVVIAASLPVIVGLARVYQGMHFPSDVVAGVALGVASLAICHRVIGPPPDAIEHRDEMSGRPEPAAAGVVTIAGRPAASDVEVAG